MIDVIYIPIAIAIVIIGILVAVFIFNSLSDVFINNSISSNYFQKLKQNVNPIFPYLILAFYFGIPTAAIVLALIGGSEIFFAVLSISLLILNVFLAGIMKDVIINFSNSLPSLEVIKNNYFVSLAVEYYPFAMFVFGLLILAAQFLFKQQEY